MNDELIETLRANVNPNSDVDIPALHDKILQLTKPRTSDIVCVDCASPAYRMECGNVLESIEGHPICADCLGNFRDPIGDEAGPMTPKQYAEAIDRLGLSQRAAGAFLGVDERQSRRWIAGDARIPEAVAKLLRLMVKLKLSPDDVE